MTEETKVQSPAINAEKLAALESRGSNRKTLSNAFAPDVQKNNDDLRSRASS